MCKLNCNACGLYCRLVGVFFWVWMCTDCFTLSIVNAPLLTFIGRLRMSILQHKRPRPKSMRASHGEGRRGGVLTLPSSLSSAASPPVASPVVSAGESEH
jgi:hypothetical protein